MFKRSVSNDTAPTQAEEPSRVYVTSLNSIAASSPTKTKWTNASSTLASNPPSPSPVRRALRLLLRSTRPSTLISKGDNHINEPIISDSITDSKRLQSSILVLTQDESLDEQEKLCCKQSEGDAVVRALQKKAGMQINEGRLKDALQNLNKSLALQQKIYGKKHSKVASTLNTMGEVLSNMGEDYRYMAMSALEEALAIRQETEPGSEDTAVTLKNLWLLLHQSNVAIVNSSVDKEEMITFQDFGTSARAVY